MKTNIARRALLATAFAFAAFPAAAQTYPARPITLVVPVPAGGAPDVAARAIAQQMSIAFGQPVVVQNRPGASGVIGGEAVARARPDGYTLLFAFTGVITINPHVSANISYNTLTDLVPVAPVAESELLLVVSPTLPVRTYAEFVKYAKEANPPLTYGSRGVGNLAFRAMERLKASAGIDLLHVPYAGAIDPLQAVVSGEISATLAGSGAPQEVAAGRLRALASTGPKRRPDMPDLPTLAEVQDGLVETSWFGVFAPAGTPKEVTEVLRDAVLKARQIESVRTAFDSGGMYASTMTPEEFARMIPEEYAAMDTLFESLGVQPK